MNVSGHGSGVRTGAFLRTFSSRSSSPPLVGVVTMTPQESGSPSTSTDSSHATSHQWLQYRESARCLSGSLSSFLRSALDALISYPSNPSPFDGQTPSANTSAHRWAADQP